MDAINTYIPKGKTPEDLVRWSRAQVGGGPLREDLALSNAEELNESVEDLERWGLPILRDGDGNVTRGDMILGLNRLSSLMWIFMIKLKAGRYERK